MVSDVSMVSDVIMATGVCSKLLRFFFPIGLIFVWSYFSGVVEGGLSPPC
jgi:hypothetical protein